MKNISILEYILKPCKVTLIEELHEDMYWTVKSKEVPGLLLWGKDLSKLRMDVPAAILLLNKLNKDS